MCKHDIICNDTCIIIIGYTIMTLMEVIMISDSFGPYDVSEWEFSIRPVTGRYPKIELICGEDTYLIKFAAYKQNKQEIPYHLSEYIASKIIKSLGYKVHEVAIVEYHGRPGCLIQLYKESLVTFGGLGTSTLEGENLIYDLDSLQDLFNEGKYADDFEAYLWDTFLLDALISNLDRHPNNWGFFKRFGLYYQAPLFDNASSLYSINAFDVNKMLDLEMYIQKFGRSRVNYKGEQRSFEHILTTATSPKMGERLQLFKVNLKDLDLSCLATIKRSWPQYTLYIDFVYKYIERQVRWFESRL